jgi:hypothetical protein
MSIVSQLYTLFQNGTREHESEAKGARFREIIIDCTTREKFLKIFAHFFAEKDISVVYGQFDTAKDEIYGKIRALRRPAVL